MHKNISQCKSTEAIKMFSRPIFSPPLQNLTHTSVDAQVRAGQIRTCVRNGLERGPKEGILSRYQGEDRVSSRIFAADRLLRWGGMSLNLQKCLTSPRTGSYGKKNKQGLIGKARHARLGST